MVVLLGGQTAEAKPSSVLSRARSGSNLSASDFLPLSWIGIWRRIADSSKGAKGSTGPSVYHLDGAEPCRLGMSCPVASYFHFSSGFEAKELTAAAHHASAAYGAELEGYPLSDYRMVLYQLSPAERGRWDPGDAFYNLLRSCGGQSAVAAKLRILAESGLIDCEWISAVELVDGELVPTGSAEPKWFEVLEGPPGSIAGGLSQSLQLTTDGKLVLEELNMASKIHRRRENLAQDLKQVLEIQVRAATIAQTIEEFATSPRVEPVLSRELLGILPRLMDRDAPQSESVGWLSKRFPMSKRRAQAILDGLWLLGLADREKLAGDMWLYNLAKSAFEVAGGMEMVREKVLASPHRKIRNLVLSQD